MSPQLILSTLGDLSIQLGGKPITGFPTRKVKALLVYLAVEKAKIHRRESLFTLLWPEVPETSARNNLRQVLYYLRKTIPRVASYSGDNQIPLLISDHYTVQINPNADLSVDLHCIDQLLEEMQSHGHYSLADCEPCLQKLERVISLYHGEFLVDFYLDNSSLFENWADAICEAYRRKILEAMAILVDIYLQNADYAQAKNLAEQQLEINPLSEKAYRQLMETLARDGHRVKALRQYRICKQILKNELDISPSQETTQVYERICAEELGVPCLQPKNIDSRRYTPRHNLTSQAAPFIGRQHELEQLDEWLKEPNIRLISIVGLGGIGKTRLAIACAERQLLPEGQDQRLRFPDGIFFVPLVSLNKPDQIPSTIASAINLPQEIRQNLGLGFQSIVSPLDNLTQYLQSKTILLILDNFEHLQEGAGLVSDLLQATTSLKILITTRERLHLQEEQVFPLQGLNFPHQEVPHEPFKYNAFELFLQSARRIQPGFEIKKEEMVHLTRICSAVEGLPLALELAAGWVDMLSLSKIADEIQSSMDFLESDLCNLPERHHSIRAVCNSTWRQLSQTEKRVFARLSIFRGGFSQSGAQEICSASLQLLARLGAKSLLQYNPSSERYQIHEFLRQFGAEKLDEILVETSQIRDRHSTYFCDLAQKYFNFMLTGENQDGIDGFRIDLGNIQAGWDRAVQQGNIQNIQKAFLGLSMYLDITQQIQRVLDMCETLNPVVANIVDAFSQNTEIQPDRAEGLRLYAQILTIVGYCHFFFDHSQVREKLVGGQAVIDQLLDQGYEARFEKAWSLFFQGVFEQQFGDRSIVEGILVECLSLSREIKNDWLVLCALGWLADHACQIGNQEQAQFWSSSILDEARARNNITGEAGAWITMGDVYRFFGENEKAQKVYKKGLDIFLSHHQFQDASTALFQLGFLNLSLGFLEAMTVRLRQGVTLLIDHDLPQHAINILVSLGMTLWARGDLVKAGETFEESLSLSQQYACNPSIFATTANAEYLAIMGAYQQADEQLQNLKTLPEELLTERFLRGKFLSGYFRQILGWIALGEGRYAEASDHFKRSIRIFQSIKSRESEAYAKAQLARAEFGLGNKRTAHNLLREALETEIEIPGYVAMIFTLPIALLILTEEEYPFAQKVYQQIRSDPFMGNAQIFEDLVYQHLPEKIRCFPITKAANTPEHRNALWNTARLVLSALSENP